MHSMRKSLIAASLVGVALVVAPACATKTFVRTEVGTVAEKVSADVSARSDTLSKAIEEVGKAQGVVGDVLTVSSPVSRGMLCPDPRNCHDVTLDARGDGMVRIGGATTKGVVLSSGGGRLAVGNENLNPNFAVFIRGSGSNVSQRTVQVWNPVDDDNDRILIDFYRKGGGGAEVGYISATGTGTTYVSTSDRRVKEHITDSTIGLDTLRRVRAREFNFIADPAHRVPGFIAQELFEVYPHAVSAPTDAGRSWGVDYGKLSPLLVQSVQDLDSIVQNLRTEVEAANRHIGELTNRLRQFEAAAAFSRADDGAPREVAIARD